MTFVVVFIKFIDFSIGGNIADKRKNVAPLNMRLRSLYKRKER